MVDFENASLDIMSIHEVGNSSMEIPAFYSNEPVLTEDPELKENLENYFFSPFKSPEFFNFRLEEEHELNGVYNSISMIFQSPDIFHEQSIELAKILLKASEDERIKKGYLFVAFFSGVLVNDEETNAVGIFKTENPKKFLKIKQNQEIFSIENHTGLITEKIERGCLVFDVEPNNGFLVTAIDKSNKLMEPQYWKSMFLNIKSCADDYHFTHNFLDAAKTFVTNQLPEEFDVSKTDKIDFLNRSIEYFKSNDQFNEDNFNEKVFENPGIIESFNNFKQDYLQENELDFANEFEISPPAVKKQSRIFKSVLKLDKNFHIYIHGNKDLIERGEDATGRKYYKIYYEKEN